MGVEAAPQGERRAVSGRRRQVRPHRAVGPATGPTRQRPAPLFRQRATRNRRQPGGAGRDSPGVSQGAGGQVGGGQCMQEICSGMHDCGRSAGSLFLPAVPSQLRQVFLPPVRPRSLHCCSQPLQQTSRHEIHSRPASGGRRGRLGVPQTALLHQASSPTAIPGAREGRRACSSRPPRASALQRPRRRRRRRSRSRCRSRSLPHHAVIPCPVQHRLRRGHGPAGGERHGVRPLCRCRPPGPAAPCRRRRLRCAWVLCAAAGAAGAAPHCAVRRYEWGVGPRSMGPLQAPTPCTATAAAARRRAPGVVCALARRAALLSEGQAGS